MLNKQHAGQKSCRGGLGSGTVTAHLQETGGDRWTAHWGTAITRCRWEDVNSDHLEWPMTYQPPHWTRA